MAIIAYNAFILSLYASAYLYVAPYAQEEFHTGEQVSRLPFVFYVMVWGVGTLFLVPLSDLYGRKPIFIASCALWVIWHVGAARANNMATLTVTRAFAGLVGTATLAVGGSYAVEAAQGLVVAKGIVIYSCGVFLGPAIGPLIGGAVANYVTFDNQEKAGWRWVFYSAIIAGVISVILFIFAYPETNRSVLLQRKARLIRKHYPHLDVRLGFEPPKLGEKVLYIATTAGKMIITEPIVIFISLWQTTVLGVLYLFFEAFPIVYGPKDLYYGNSGYGFNAFQIGLAFLGIALGITLGGVYGFTLDLKFYVKMVMARRGARPPELRAYLGIGSSVLATISLFWFGFTTYSDSVHWIVSIIASVFYGMSVMGVLLVTIGYTVDAYGPKSGAAFAAEALIRSCITAILPLFGDKMFRNLGPRYAVLILALISMAEIAIPVVALLYGKTIRGWSNLAVKG
ncbi:MFS general substrate transporter [Acaromyces ingoldii]|uniref:MFS general substrate transporter n=1 Tax=Acaromyces ingoldii TaxID=215250 RepID=A0A316YFE1_9BASI|nr:MFS general substrate transporter [Acaromyces ingoldii]PWN88270.1 MFS general substrate transporter [Acaromyces ingoldii]